MLYPTRFYYFFGTALSTQNYDFSEQVMSLEVDNKAVEECRAGDLVGIRVRERVRENDKVYRVEE